VLEALSDGVVGALCNSKSVDHVELLLAKGGWGGSWLILRRS
jgi:hypothetical protein